MCSFATNADRDSAGVHVTIVDVPAFFADFWIAAAREVGHVSLKLATPVLAITLDVGGE
jgi:hypothetical protein